MTFRSLSGTVEDGVEVKSIGDVIVVDGVKHVVDEVNTYHEQWDGVDVHKFTYTLKPFVAVELTDEELQSL